MFDFKNCYILRRKYNISLIEIRAIENFADFLKKKYGKTVEISTAPIEEKSVIICDILENCSDAQYSISAENDNKIFVKGTNTDAVACALERLTNVLTYFNDLSELPITETLEHSTVVDGYKLIYNTGFEAGPVPKCWRKHPEINFGARGNENTQGVKKPCWMSDNNYTTEDNKLVLFGSTDGENYYSAELRSDKGFQFKYGYVEISAKIAGVHGGCPAFWLLGSEDPLEYVKPEIDVFECFGDPYQIKATTLVWAGKNNHDFPSDSYFGHNINKVNHKASDYSFYQLPDGDKFSDAYHTYGLEWDENELIWYCDGNEFCRVSIADKLSKRAMSFHQEMFIILTQYCGVAVYKMSYPTENPDYENMKTYVDYVKLYQRKGSLVNGRITDF